jgi:hypothetical protein
MDLRFPLSAFLYIPGSKVLPVISTYGTMDTSRRPLISQNMEAWSRTQSPGLFHWRSWPATHNRCQNSIPMWSHQGGSTIKTVHSFKQAKYKFMFTSPKTVTEISMVNGRFNHKNFIGAQGRAMWGKWLPAGNLEAGNMNSKYHVRTISMKKVKSSPKSVAEPRMIPLGLNMVRSMASPARNYSLKLL